MIALWTPPEALELLLAVEVGGDHVPAGSKNGFAVRYKDERGIWRVKIRRDQKGNEHAEVTVSDTNSSKLKVRAREIQEQVREAARLVGFQIPDKDQPLAVTCTFYKPRKKNQYGTGRNADVLKETAPAFPIAAPDATKLWRGFEDALTGHLWHDDSRVVGQGIWEDWVERWEPPLTRFALYGLPATVAARKLLEEDQEQATLAV